MLIYAHRGLHGDAQENTMDSFFRAEKAGLDGIETDLRTTRDGQVVLFHDRTVRGEAVANLTYADLLDLSGISVPTLEHVLTYDWHIAWNFEFKTTASVVQSIPLLRKAMPKEVMFSSFIHAAVRHAVDELGGEGALLTASLPMDDTMLPHPTPGIRTLVWDWNVATPDAFEDAEAVGWRNMVYGPVTRGEHEALTVLRPHAVITDHPSLIARNTNVADGERR